MKYINNEKEINKNIKFGIFFSTFYTIIALIFYIVCLVNNNIATLILLITLATWGVIGTYYWKIKYTIIKENEDKK